MPLLVASVPILLVIIKTTLRKTASLLAFKDLEIR
jgi:hypothetical protein